MPGQNQTPARVIILILFLVVVGAGIYLARRGDGGSAPAVDPNVEPFAGVAAPSEGDEATRTRIEQEIVGTKKLWEEKPDIWETWIAIGNLKYLLKDYDGAIAAYQKSLQLTPTNILGYRNIAEVYRNGREDYAKAAQYYRLALNQNFQDIELYQSLAELYYQNLNDVEKAEQVYNEGLKRFSANPDLLTGLINMYRTVGNREKYVETVAALRAAYPDNQTYQTAYSDVPLQRQ